MDIKHFSYFITIVESNFNLSSAAKKIHISQSTLSKVITSFENTEGVQLFNRHNGRLVSLTSAGSKFYYASLKIIQIYDELLENIMQEAANIKGKVIIGIPPLVLTVVFSKLISNFSVYFPNIELEIIEAGAEELREKFINNAIDFAVLLSPTNLEGESSKEYTIYLDELTAFVSKKNNFVSHRSLDWADLHKKRIAIFNETFTINRLLLERFCKEKIEPIIAIKSASWDFLLESVHDSDILTILPSPIKNYVYNSDNFIEIPFANPIPWEVVLVEHTDRKLTAAQNYFKQHLLDASAQ